MARGTIIARDIRVDGDGATTLFSCEVAADGAGLPSRLWFRFPSDVAPLIDPGGSAFVPILVLVAMRLHQDLHIEGEVSPELLRSVPRLMAIYADWSRDFEPLWRVKVTAATAANPPRGNSAAAFFSCGLDSTFTLLKNVKRYPPGDARLLSHLLIVHGFDVHIDDELLFEQLLERGRRVADAYGKRLVPVATNAREGGFRCVDWQHYGHGPGLASVGLALGRGFHTIYIPATDDALHLDPWGSHPAVDPLWSTETVEFVHDGLEARRVDKVRYISQVPLFLSTLRVCMSGRRGVYNCGECVKCLRGMVEFDLLGTLHRSETFPTRLDLGDVTNLAIPADRTRRYWMDLRHWAHDLGRAEIVAAIDTAIARSRRADYEWLAPCAPVLTKLGVTSERLRRLKRGVLRRLSKAPSPTEIKADR